MLCTCATSTLYPELALDRSSDFPHSQVSPIARVRTRSDGWLLDSLADGVVLLDAELRVTFINRAARRMLVLPRDGMADLPPARDRIPGADEDGDLFRHVMHNGKPCRLRGIQLGAPELADRLFDAEIHPSPEGGVAVVFRDVTTRTGLRQARQAAADAEAANVAKSQFLSMMSHEIRTPINAILGYAELLELGIPGPITDAQRTQLGRLRASATHLIGLVNEVLDIAKVESGQLVVEREPASAAQTAAAALALVRPEAAAHDIAIVNRCVESSGDRYLGDEQRVRQIVVNLLSNAIKFTESGGRISVTCGTVPQFEADAALPPGRPWVFIRVEDTGIGIAPEQLAAIFEPFVQVDAGHARRRSGTGLGLAISRRLARLMGGDLTVASRPAEGSAFTLWLPVATPGEASIDATAEQTREAPRTTLRIIGERLEQEIRPVMHALVDRMRSDPTLPRTQGLDDAQIEDHQAAFLIDIVHQLIIIGDSGGQSSPLMRDGTEIQTLIASHHGAQRFRLGWTPDQLRHEFHLLREEMQIAVERVAPPGDEAALAAARAIVDRLLEFAERVSARGFRLAAG
jgi:signal transduction histidine kinase